MLELLQNFVVPKHKEEANRDDSDDSFIFLSFRVAQELQLIESDRSGDEGEFTDTAQHKICQNTVFP